MGAAASGSHEFCFVLLIPTPEEYRVPRVNPGVTASKLFPPLLPSLVSHQVEVPVRPSDRLLRGGGAMKGGAARSLGENEEWNKLPWQRGQFRCVRGKCRSLVEKKAVEFFFERFLTCISTIFDVVFFGDF